MGLIPDNFVELLSSPEPVEPPHPQSKQPPVAKEVASPPYCHHGSTCLWLCIHVAL